MRLMMMVTAALALVGCEEMDERPRGVCEAPFRYLGDAQRVYAAAYTRACLEERSRLQADALRDAAIREGRPVTECVQSGNTQTCTTY